MILLLPFLLSCDFDAFDYDIDDLFFPPEPSFLQVTVDCSGGLLEVEAMLESEYRVSNVTIEREDEDETALEPLFPTLDVEAMSGAFSRWSFETEHDCDTPLMNTWTAYTVLGSSASYEVAWPDVDLEEGALDPPHGTDAGGSTVTIVGESMEAVTAVWFGENEATLGEASDTELTVTTPAGDVGTVDVTLEAPFTEVLLDDAFTYWPDATGMVTGFSLMHVHVYSPSYFSVGSGYVTLDVYGPFAQFELFMQEPLAPDVTYPVIYGDAGACTGDDYEWAATSVGSYLTFENDELGSLAMLPAPSGSLAYYYVESDVDPDLWGGQAFDLGIVEQTEQFAEMTVDDALLIPTMPSDPSFDWETTNSFTWGEDLVFSWTDTSAQRVAWTLYPAAGWTTLDTISCMADATTGELVVPWDTLTANIDETQVTTVFATLTFIEDDWVIMPHDNSWFWSLGFIDTWLYAQVVEP